MLLDLNAPGKDARAEASGRRHPQLRATENFQQLQRQLSELEDEIQASRRIYNSNVQRYNTRTQQFPTLLIAGPMAFTPCAFFEIEAPAERPRERRGPARSQRPQ